MKPPPRLIDDPSAAPELRADLERVAASAAPYDARAGLLELQSAIAATGSASGAPHGAARLGSSAAKIGALSAAAVVLAAAAVFAWTGFRPPTKPKPGLTAPAAAAAPAATTAPAASTPRTEHAPPPAPQPGQQVRAAEALAPDATPKSVAPKSIASRVPAPDAGLQREVAQLGRIKRLLAHDPQQAYRLAQAGHREFRAGMLRHEREGLAILALWQLERRAEAGRRTRAFLARYPESPLREQLAQRLAHAGEPSAQEP